VREADMRANRWHRRLSEGAKALADAGGTWPRRWRALLPPWTQLTFFYDRLRRRFRYGGHRLYALKSLQRFGPYVVIPVVVAALYLYDEERRSAERIRTDEVGKAKDAIGAQLGVLDDTGRVAGSSN
jgi:hypothetical protein